MKLTDTACRNAKAKKKAYKMFDGGGLYLHVQPNESKYWRLKYCYLGKEKLLSLGVYPTVTLAEARQKRQDARKLLDKDIDPSERKKRRKREARINAENTFEAVALEWHKKKSETWAKRTAQKVMRYLKADVFPHIGNRPIANIDAPELLDMLRNIENRGAHY